MPTPVDWNHNPNDKLHKKVPNNENILDKWSFKCKIEKIKKTFKKPNIPASRWRLSNKRCFPKIKEKKEDQPNKKNSDKSPFTDNTGETRLLFRKLKSKKENSNTYEPVKK